MSKYNPKIHNRRSIRLKGYDYSKAGLYFITFCCQNRIHFYGEIINGEMILNDACNMIEDEWIKLPLRFKNIRLHEYIIMPNHFHSILEIVIHSDDNYVVGQPQGIAPRITDNLTTTDNPTTDNQNKSKNTENSVRKTLVVSPNNNNNNNNTTTCD